MSYQITIGTENNISVTLAPMTYRVAIEQLAQSEIDSQVTAAQAARDLADTYASDAQSARDQSQTARDTAEDHKLAAEAAATSATNTASALTGFDLDAIAETKADTAVDVFVYDTSRDSDGGAWRKRTQHTSWYNETLNTSTRGSRREFPAVAVIVAETDKVTIYDGDDPSLPMWRVTNPTVAPSGVANFWRANRYPSSSTAGNGKIVVGVDDSNSASILGVLVWDYVADEIRRVDAAQTIRGDKITDDALDIDLTVYSSDSIVNGVVNDVAMTILPDSPIDPATGLPVPTIAVATDGGVSVIKDDGAVVDLTRTSTVFDVVNFHKQYLQIGSSDLGAIWYYDNIPASDETLSPDRGHIEYYDSGFSNQDTPAYLGYQNTKLAGFYAATSGANDSGVTAIQFDAATPANSMVNYITGSYQSGWQNGDIKGAFLSDTDDTDLVGSGELVTNGTFDTDSDWTKGTGWAISGGTANLDTSVTGAGVFTSLSQDITTVAGKNYVLSVDVTALANVSINEIFIRVNGTSAGTSITATSTEIRNFVASGSTTTISIDAGVGQDGDETISIDNISVKLADEDRSVNSNGLIVNGTITRTFVDEV